MQITIRDALKFINTSEFVFYTSDFVATEQPEKPHTFPHTHTLSLLIFLYRNFLKIENTKNYSTEETVEWKNTFHVFKDYFLSRLLFHSFKLNYTVIRYDIMFCIYSKYCCGCEICIFFYLSFL